MVNQPNHYDPLIDQFFKNLNQLQFTEAVAVLTEMEQQSSENIPYALWARYLAGVLSQEEHRDWAAAERTFQEVLTAEPPDDLRADIYLSLGIAYENQARWDESVAIAQKGIDLWERLGIAIKKTMLLRQIAIACYRGFEAGDLDSSHLVFAADRCDEALAILTDYQPPAQPECLYELDHHLYEALIQQVLGCVYTCMGDYQAAQQIYMEFLNLSLSRQNQFHIGCASLYLADVMQLGQQHARQTIETLYQDALTIFQEKGATLFQAYLLASWGSLYRRHNMAEKAIRAYQEALALLEQMRQQISSDEARLGFFATVMNIHDNSLLAELENGSLANAFGCAEMARSRVMVDRLVGPQETKQGGTATISLVELQRLLGVDDLVVEFHCTGLLSEYHGHSTEQAAAHNVLYPTPKTLIFLIDRREIVCIDAQISPNMLLMQDTTQAGMQFFSSPALCRTLYDKLLAPVAQHFIGKRRVYIIPHGPLHYIPFHALTAPDDEALLRAEGPDFVYAPSATILCRSHKPQHEGTTGSCLAVGYNGDGDMELRFAEEEAAYIAQMAKGDALIGSTHKKAAIYTQAPHYRALHFSCHGEFDPVAPLQSRLHIGPREHLTGQEIMENLKLNCELVTLSACESGLSKVRRGDELYGLIRAFLYAGSPAILATLWRVDERTTLLFAEKFYALVQQGFPYAKALKSAQLYLKNLSREEALAILTHHGKTNSLQTTSQPQLEAERYLKGFNLATPAPKSKSSAEQLVADEQSMAQGIENPAVIEEDDEPIFADPQFWAPFILIGTAELS